jgi:lysophospholipase L1-like esterase
MFLNSRIIITILLMIHSVGVMAAWKADKAKFFNSNKHGVPIVYGAEDIKFKNGILSFKQQVKHGYFILKSPGIVDANTHSIFSFRLDAPVSGKVTLFYITAGGRMASIDIPVNTISGKHEYEIDLAKFSCGRGYHSKGFTGYKQYGGKEGKITGIRVDTWFKTGAKIKLDLIKISGPLQEDTVLTPKPIDIVSIKGEKISLGKYPAKNYSRGAKLKYLQTLSPGRGTTAPYALIPESIIVKENGRILKKGHEYSCDTTWGTVGIGKDKKSRNVTVDYKFKLLRIDSVIQKNDGTVVLRKGESNLTTPLLPELQSGEKRQANIFVNYYKNINNKIKLPVIEGAEKAITATSSGNIPKTLEKLKSGKPVTVVCWGDSVTAGGDASGKDTQYPAVFENMLKNNFPESTITVKVIAVPGASSAQWLYPEKHAKNFRTKRCKWSKIIAAKPNLITVEFVNDAWLNSEQVERQYSEILKRAKAINAEVILITPNYTRMSMMGFKNKLSGPDRRTYVKELKKFAKNNNIAIADASARWEHLKKEGIPYIIYLRNAINHPDDRGHRLYAEELLKCFRN